MHISCVHISSCWEHNKWYMPLVTFKDQAQHSWLNNLNLIMNRFGVYKGCRNFPKRCQCACADWFWPLIWMWNQAGHTTPVIDHKHEVWTLYSRWFRKQQWPFKCRSWYHDHKAGVGRCVCVCARAALLLVAVCQHTMMNCIGPLQMLCGIHCHSVLWQ